MDVEVSRKPEALNLSCRSRNPERKVPQQKLVVPQEGQSERAVELGVLILMKQLDNYGCVGERHNVNGRGWKSSILTMTNRGGSQLGRVVRVCRCISRMKGRGLTESST